VAYQATGDHTVYQLAYQLLGDGGQAHRLEVAGWDGQDPQYKPPEGAQVKLPGERPGPPSAWLLDPARWGRAR